MAGYFTKKRTIPSRVNWKTGYVSGGVQLNLDSFLDPTLQVTQVTTSYSSLDRTGSQTQQEFLRDSLEASQAQSRSLTGDTGHTFSTTKREIIYDQKRKVYSTNVVGGKCYVRSPLWIYESSQSKAWPSIPSSDLNYYGTAAIRKTIPTSPIAGLSTFTGELHQLPQLFGTNLLRDQADLFRGIGGEYLNVVFGWAPFVADLYKAVQSMINASVTIRQLTRDNGKTVRRQYEFEPIVSNGAVTNVTGSTATMVPNLSSSNYSPLFTAGGSSGLSKIERQEIVSTRIWFSGEYQYYIAITDNVYDRLVAFETLANKLLGTRITPAVLWNLTPWTWLSDWFSNIGDIISNASQLGSDNLVLRYGYLMCQKTLNVIYTGYGFKFTNFDPGPLVTSYRQTSKQRIRATPYGFGLNPATFTARQWAILGALYLTKSPTSLRAN